MGKKFRKALLAFIDSIPNNKLEGGLPSITKTICEMRTTDSTCRTWVTTGPPKCYNLQAQVNNQALFTSARKAGSKGASVGKALMPIEAPWSAAEIKEVLRQSCIEFGDRSGQF